MNPFSCELAMKIVSSIPASSAVTTAGARRLAPSKSILIRFEEFRRIEARHSDTTFNELRIYEF